MRIRLKILHSVWKPAIFVILFTLLFTAIQPVHIAQAEPTPPVPVGHRTIRLTGNQINYSSSDPNVFQAPTGTRWKANGSAIATIGLPRPCDHNGSNDVTLSIYFMTTSSIAGDVNFSIVPSSFNAGDFFAWGSAISSSPVAVSGNSKIYKQGFTIPAARLAKDLWEIQIKRESLAYIEDVVIQSVEIDYMRNLIGFTACQSLTAKALNFDNASTVIYQDHTTGLRWTKSSNDAAAVALPRPKDWDGVSDVTMDLFFYPDSSGTGNTGFFIRPRSYSPGDTFGDISDLNSNQPVSSVFVIMKQSFSIPASRFGDKELLYITIQRLGVSSLDTYAGDLILTGLSLTYGKKSSPVASIGLPANSLAFVEGTIINQSRLGLTWSNGYQSGGYLILPHHYGWTGGGLYLKMYFRSADPGAGEVQFFIRPRAFNIGDQFADAASTDGIPAHVASQGVIYAQTFYIPPEKTGVNDLWVITMQRGGSQETYTGNVDLMAVELSTPNQLYLPLTLK